MNKSSLGKQLIPIGHILDRHAYYFPSTFEGFHAGMLDFSAFSCNERAGMGRFSLLSRLFCYEPGKYGTRRYLGGLRAMPRARANICPLIA